VKLFPIGDLQAQSSQGLIDGKSYSFFEPNAGCTAKRVYNILTTRFQDQTILTRKKAETYLSITYKYQNIFAREFRQLEHFIESVDEALTSFYLVNLDSGVNPSNIASSLSRWNVTIDGELVYSATTNMKSNFMFLWDGLNFKVGDITSITPSDQNYVIAVDVFTNNYGDLTLSRAQSSAVVYPIYEVYTQTNALGSFESTYYIPLNISTSNDGGFMKSGVISFITKYRV